MATRTPITMKKPSRMTDKHHSTRTGTDHEQMPTSTEITFDSVGLLCRTSCKVLCRLGRTNVRLGKHCLPNPQRQPALQPVSLLHFLPTRTPSCFVRADSKSYSCSFVMSL